MRVIPLITALFVLGSLYLLVIERETLIAFASGQAGDAHASDARDPDAEGADPAPDGEAGAIRVAVLRSHAREVDNTVLLRGRTEAARQVDVRAETSGLVVSEPLRRGADVRAGDALCELAPGVRTAALQEARARLAEAEITYNAATQLSEGGFASQTRLASSTAALETAQAAVERAIEELARLVMHAPFDGLLESDTAELGSLLQPGALCATLIKLDPIRLVGFVPETQVDQLEPGAAAEARLASGRMVTGAVTFISRAADPATRTFRVEVTVENPDNSIRDGQSAEIEIRAAATRGHLLPGSALTLDDDGALGVRVVDPDSRAQFVPVTMLRDTDRGMWLGGLPESADVIVVGQEFVREGVLVDAVMRPAAHAAPASELPDGTLPPDEAAP